MKVDNTLAKTPKISVIITYYNLGKFIKDCVSSILKQTYQNFEIIIVNDGSDVENSQILGTIKSDKIKIINLSENSGQLIAFIKGLEIANGEFICMTDADDILLPDFLKTLLYIHLNNNVALVSSSCGEINENNEILSLNYINNKKYKNFKKRIKYSETDNLFNTKDEFEIKKVSAPFGLWSWNPSTSAMFRRESLEILKFYPDFQYWKTGADKVIFSFLHLIGGSINTSAVCFLYRHHSKNQSETTYSTGDKKYLSENYINKLIKWNKKIRLDAIKLFIDNKEQLIKKYNKINYLKMFLKIVFCINLNTFIKIFKTGIYKIIKF